MECQPCLEFGLKEDQKPVEMTIADSVKQLKYQENEITLINEALKIRDAKITTIGQVNAAYEE